MDYLMVIDNATGESRAMTLVEAAALTHIGPEDIVQSIYAFGICQSIDHVILDTEAADDILAA
ncbi:hypothetical protein [Sinorhizobium fredii]